MSLEQKQIIVGVVINIVVALLSYFVGYKRKKGENQALLEDARKIYYEAEKGKNLATKEDLTKITEEIESVKTEIKENSFRRQDKFIQYKEALVEFNKEYILFLEYYMRDITATLSLTPDSKEIRETLNSLIKQFTLLFAILNRAAIFAEGQNDKESIKDLHGEFIKSKPLYDLTFTLLEQCASIATDIERFREENTPYHSLSKSLLPIWNKYKTDRDGVESSALDSINQVNEIIRKNLGLKYN